MTRTQRSEARAGRLLRSLPDAHPGVRRGLVALSGGVDSTALLLLASRCLPPRWSVGAVHVHHGLHPAADAWARHCADLCRLLDIPLQVIRVKVARTHAGPEADARSARYRAFEAIVDSATVLLLAQQRDDQAETFLMRALRGSGLRGLAGMPAERPLGRGRLLRPLLGCSRDELAAIVEGAGIDPVVDPANADPALERGFLRQQVLPALRRRRPGVDRTLARAADQCREAAGVLDWFVERELDRLLRGDGSRLDLGGLRRHPKAVRREVLRAWLRARGQPLPGRRRLESLVLQCEARPDAEVEVAWGGITVRRYGDELHIDRPPPGAEALRLEWHSSRLELPSGLGVLEWLPRQGRRPEAGWPRVEVRFRQGGERLRPAGARHRRRVKHLLQELRVPPWRRDRLPLVYAGEELLAVADLVTSDALEQLVRRHEVVLRFRPGPAG